MSAFAGPGGSEAPLTEAAIADAGDSRYVKIVSTSAFGRSLVAAGDAASARSVLDLIKQTSRVDNVANHVLLTGAYGLGQAIPLQNDNCLAIRISGSYYMYGSTSNLPSGATEGYLTVTYYDDNNIIYEFTQYNNSAVNNWICVRAGGTYGSWINTGSQMLADRAFRRGNILGTVSQTSGVPTGGLIETGSNSSGTYVRFADGTQICRGTRVIAAATGANWSTGGAGGTFSYTNGAEGWSSPASFAVTPNIVCMSKDGAVSGRGAYVTFASPTITGIGTIYLVAPVTATNAAAAGSDITVEILAMGRWF